MCRLAQSTGRTGQRQWRDSVYGQDDLKVSDKLTLNLGLRWEFDQPIYEVNNKMANINMQTKEIHVRRGKRCKPRSLQPVLHTIPTTHRLCAFQPTPSARSSAEDMVFPVTWKALAPISGLTQNPPFHKDFEQTATVPAINERSRTPPAPFLQASDRFPDATSTHHYLLCVAFEL